MLNMRVVLLNQERVWVLEPAHYNALHQAMGRFV